MNKKILTYVTAGVAVAALGLFAQAPAPKLEFEVASIKPAPPLDPAAIQQGKIHIGMNIDGARVDIGGLPMQTLLVQAFNIKPYQLGGAASAAGMNVAAILGSDRWDILAKIPEGATKDDVPKMLVKLLEDRFGLKYHHESKDLNVYGLIVGKGGSKLVETTATEDKPLPDQPGAVTVNSGDQKIRVNPQPGPGKNLMSMTSPQYGTLNMSMGAGGTMHLEASKMTMAGFADLLTSLVDRPVVDMTGMKGTYQVSLDLSMETLLALARNQGMIPGGPGGPGGGGPPGGPGGANIAVPTASDPGAGGSVVFDAVQKLGLKLDARKAPVDTIVVDHIEKMPTDN